MVSNRGLIDALSVKLGLLGMTESGWFTGINHRSHRAHGGRTTETTINQEQICGSFQVDSNAISIFLLMVKVPLQYSSTNTSGLPPLSVPTYAPICPVPLNTAFSFMLLAKEPED
jgi:hypothetical protein